MKNLKKIADLEKVQIAIKTKIMAKIRDIKQNKDFVEMGIRCGIVRSKDLAEHDNWAVAYHDFRASADLVYDIILHAPPQAIDKILGDAIEHETIKSKNGWQKLHPEFLKQLEAIRNS